MSTRRVTFWGTARSRSGEFAPLVSGRRKRLGPQRESFVGRPVDAKDLARVAEEIEASRAASAKMKARALRGRDSNPRHGRPPTGLGYLAYFVTRNSVIPA